MSMGEWEHGAEVPFSPRTVSPLLPFSLSPMLRRSPSQLPVYTFLARSFVQPYIA